MVLLLLVKPTPRNNWRQKNHLSVSWFFYLTNLTSSYKGRKEKNVQEKAQQTPPSSGTQVPGWWCTFNTPTPLSLLIERNLQHLFLSPVLSLPTGAQDFGTDGYRPPKLLSSGMLSSTLPTLHKKCSLIPGITQIWWKSYSSSRMERASSGWISRVIHHLGAS